MFRILRLVYHCVFLLFLPVSLSPPLFSLLWFLQLPSVFLTVPFLPFWFKYHLLASARRQLKANPFSHSEDITCAFFVLSIRVRWLPRCHVYKAMLKTELACNKRMLGEIFCTQNNEHRSLVLSDNLFLTNEMVCRDLIDKISSGKKFKSSDDLRFHPG